MKCEIEGCKKEALSKVTWIGNVKWVGFLCKECIEEMWQQHRGLVSLGKADVIFDEVKK